MKILAKNIKTKEQIIQILDSLKPINRYINTLSEGSFEYERLCNQVEDHYLEIDEALTGKEVITTENLVNSDIRRMLYWDYIRDEIDWDEFVSQIKEYSDKLLVDLN